MKSIAVCITVHNRNETAKICVENWRKFMPENSELFVIDDNSDIQFEYATHRSDETMGIPKAKNKCLAVSDGFENVFCVDDDVWPVNKYWHWPYVNSGLEHACYTFDRNILSYGPNYVEYEKPCGLMMFFTRKCIDTIGGWDESFHTWGYEHVNVSDRAFNAGLTPARYIDGAGSNFYSLDKAGIIESSVSNYDRAMGIMHNEPLYHQKFNSKEFKPYK